MKYLAILILLAFSYVVNAQDVDKIDRIAVEDAGLNLQRYAKQSTTGTLWIMGGVGIYGIGLASKVDNSRGVMIMSGICFVTGVVFRLMQ